jgi:hypothetical protein
MILKTWWSRMIICNIWMEMQSAFSLLRCLLYKNVGKELRKIILLLGVNAASSELRKISMTKMTVHPLHRDTFTILTSSPKSHKSSTSLSGIGLQHHFPFADPLSQYWRTGLQAYVVLPTECSINGDNSFSLQFVKWAKYENILLLVSNLWA